MFVIDASVALAWQFTRESAQERVRADAVLDRLADESAAVPPLFHVEVLNGCLVAERRKRLAPSLAGAFLQHLAALDLATHPLPPLRVPTLLALAREHGLSAYDAAYLELALRLGAPLYTFDRALAAAARNAGLETP